MNSGQRPPRPSAAVCPAPLWALIERCWAHRRDERPTMAEARACLPACFIINQSIANLRAQVQKELLCVASLLDADYNKFEKLNERDQLERLTLCVDDDERARLGARAIECGSTMAVAADGAEAIVAMTGAVRWLAGEEACI